MIEHTDHIKHKADEAVMRRKREQDLVDEDDMLEVVYDTFPVEIVHCRPQKVPIQSFSEPKTPSSTRDVGNSDDFLERYDLDSGDDQNDVYVSGEQ